MRTLEIFKTLLTNFSCDNVWSSNLFSKENLNFSCSVMTLTRKDQYYLSRLNVPK